MCYPLPRLLVSRFLNQHICNVKNTSVDMGENGRKNGVKTSVFVIDEGIVLTYERESFKCSKDKLSTT